MITRFIQLLPLAVTLMSGACATISEPQSITAIERETVNIAVGPCFGFCPVYEVTVLSDGTVRYTGLRHTAVLGDRTSSGHSGAYRSLVRDLRPFHPASGTEAVVACTAAVSDTSPFTVTWTGEAGTKTVATVQSGCPGGPGQSLVKLLRDVPMRLRIIDWAKQTTRRGVSRG